MRGISFGDSVLYFVILTISTKFWFTEICCECVIVQTATLINETSGVIVLQSSRTRCLLLLRFPFRFLCSPAKVKWKGSPIGRTASASTRTEGQFEDLPAWGLGRAGRRGGGWEREIIPFSFCPLLSPLSPRFALASIRARTKLEKSLGGKKINTMTRMMITAPGKQHLGKNLTFRILFDCPGLARQ